MELSILRQTKPQVRKVDETLFIAVHESFFLSSIWTVGVKVAVKAMQKGKI